MPSFLKSLVVVYCSDIQASAHFYGEILGLETYYSFPKIGEPEHFEYKIGESVIGISSFKGLQSHGLPVEVSGHPFEIGLKTDDIFGLFEYLNKESVKIIKPPAKSEAGNYFGYISDPDGNWISIYQNA